MIDFPLRSKQSRYLLISHKLCPYVQRAVITMQEKGIEYERIDIDLANKPDWFLALSPTGRVPVLIVDGRHRLFESAAICEYLDEVSDSRLHPEGALTRAQHRAWIDFASSLLAEVGKLYSALETDGYKHSLKVIRAKLECLEKAKEPGAYFSGDQFYLVDGVFASVYRYFDVFEKYSSDHEISMLFDGLDGLKRWRENLTKRDSVRSAVAGDYDVMLQQFVARKKGVLAGSLSSNVV